MWQTLLLSLCVALSETALADDLQYKREVIDKLKYSPLLRPALSYSPPASDDPTRNFGGKSFEGPWTYSKINRQFVEPDKCRQLETLQSILVQLKRLVNQEDLHDEPDKRIQILQSLKEYLERSGSDFSGIENNEKVNELIDRMDKTVVVENNALRHGPNHSNHKNYIQGNFQFKYDIPRITKVGCEEALATLIETVKNIQLQMIKYCHQTHKCELSSESHPLDTQDGDKSNILHNTLASDHQKPLKITSLNPNSLNMYDIQNSINNLGKTKNLVLTQQDYLDARKQSLLNLKNEQSAINTNSFDTGVLKSFNNNDQNIDAYNNVYLNSEANPLNMQDTAKINDLNNIFNFQQPIHTDGQNIDAIQSPNILNIPQTGVWESNDDLKLNIHPESYSTNQYLAVSAAQNKNEQKEDISNNKYVNIFDRVDINTPLYGVKHFGGTHDPFPLIQTQYLNRYAPMGYNNEPNKQSLSFKYSQILNKKSSSMAAINQNKPNIKEQIRYESAIPRYEYNNFNYLPILRPRKMPNIPPENIIPTNLETYLGKFQNQHMKQMLSPIVHSSLNMKQNPYLSYINLNRENSFNYGTQHADAAVQSNFGLNLYAPTNLVNYPKQDIYGNKLFDLRRLASVPNFVKLNSIADNGGIVELTYELKRPQPMSYNPYYYLKFRMPYRDFLSKIIDLSKNPLLRSNPIKFHKELLSVSNLAEAPPDLKYTERDEVSKLILNNGGALINAKILGVDDSNVEQHLKTIQNLNVNLNTNDILNLVGNDKTYNSIPSLNSEIFRPETNLYDGALLYQNVDS